MPQQLERKKHIKYIKNMLHIIPSHCSNFDSSRLVVAYFAISGLDILNALDELNDENKQNIIDWVLRLQISNAGSRSGFQSSGTIPKEAWKYNFGHITMTYTALAILLILGDDLSKIDKASIMEGMRACQNPDGSFTATIEGCESDMRFLYCACCISAILDDWSGINKPNAIDYILQSVLYDGAVGQGPGLESHGGFTFCAIASLYLMNELDNTFSNKQLDKLRRWCLWRQESGFQGRPGKSVDTCYSFWIGATLQLLNVGHLSNAVENRAFLFANQNLMTGGFSKCDGVPPDPIHTYFSLCGLSLLGEPGVAPLNAALNISQRAYEHLQRIQQRW